MRAARLLFWGSAVMIAYVYLLFPALLLLRGRLVRRPYLSADVTPPITVIIAARDEVQAIGAKLDNLRSLDYPPDRLEVIVVSDGSTDGTDTIVSRMDDPRIRLLAVPRLGKADALNAGIREARGDILVFSDANSLYAQSALRALVRPFADPTVGGVAGDQRYTSAARGGTSDGERRYWDFDRALKRAESASGNTISATGAIYAIRRALAEPVVRGVTDDFFVSTGVIAKGYRLVFAEDARAFEPVASSGRGEFGRKVRVITRGLRGVLVRRSLLNPRRHGFYALQLLSHKVLRRLAAMPLLVLAIAGAVLWRHGAPYRFATLAQLLFYGCGAVGLAVGPTGRRTPFGIAAYFCLVNVASLVAVVNLLRGRRIEQWQPDRQDSGAARRRGPIRG